MKKDLTGLQFGYLTVISQTQKRIQRKIVWKCLCVCGNECEILSTNLLSGRTKSCGCKQYEIVAQHYREKCPQKGDIINGTKVLDVEYRLDNRNFNECYILGECKFCGSPFWVKKTSLSKNNTKSCGCINNSSGERTIEILLDSNKIPYEREKRFEDCYFQNSKIKCRFDFFVDNKYLIEFDGEQHFIDYSNHSSWFDENSLSLIQARDRYKDKWCREHNIPLIRIPYYKLETLSIEDLLLDKTKYLITDKEEV